MCVSQDASYDDLPTVSTSTSAQQQRKRRSVTDAVDWAADKVALAGASSSSSGGGGRRPNAVADVDQGAYLALGTRQPRAEITANRHDTAKILARLQVAFAALPDSTSTSGAASPRGNNSGTKEYGFSPSNRGMPQLNETWNDEDDDDDGGSSIGALTIDSSLREVDGGKLNNRAADGGGGGRIGGGNAVTVAAKGQFQPEKKGRESPANRNNHHQPEAAAPPMPGEAQMASEWQNATVVARDTLAGACPHVQAVAEAAASTGGRGRSTVQPTSEENGAGTGDEGKVEAAAAALAAAVLPALNPLAWQAQSEAYARAFFTSKHLDLCAAALTDQVGCFF